LPRGSEIFDDEAGDARVPSSTSSVKRSALPLLVLTWVISLALPFSLHPTFVVLPFATLFALSVAVTASTFTKYLQEVSIRIALSPIT